MVALNLATVMLQVAEAVGTDHPLGAHVAGEARQPSTGAGMQPQLDAAAANNVVPLSAPHNQARLLMRPASLPN